MNEREQRQLDRLLAIAEREPGALTITSIHGASPPWHCRIQVGDGFSGYGDTMHAAIAAALDQIGGFVEPSCPVESPVRARMAPGGLRPELCPRQSALFRQVQALRRRDVLRRRDREALVMPELPRESNVPRYEDLRTLVDQLVLTGDVLADKLTDVSHVTLDTADWWADLENRRDLWADVLERATRALERSKVGR